MPPKPTTVKAYLDALPDDRRKALGAVRAAIRKNLPVGYKEGIQYGMIGYFVPHSVYPPGYHCDPKQPLPFLSLASQKNHMAVYLFCLYNDAKATAKFERDWKAAVGRLDMGKSCVRFKKLEDVPLDVLGRAVKLPAKTFVKQYEANLEASGIKHPGKPAAKKTGKKKVTKKTAKGAAGKKKATKKRVAKKPTARKTTRKPAPKKKAARRAR